MRISDWSSDVCSSDLRATDPRVGLPLPEGLETLARFHQPEGRRRNSRSWLRRAMTTAINERVVMRHGSPVVIRKVVTGGYWHDNGLGRRGGYAPRQITLYVRLGRWRESVLTVPRAMKIAERFGRKALRR